VPKGFFLSLILLYTSRLYFNRWNTKTIFFPIKCQNESRLWYSMGDDNNNNIGTWTLDTMIYWRRVKFVSRGINAATYIYDVNGTMHIIHNAYSYEYVLYNNDVSKLTIDGFSTLDHSYKTYAIHTVVYSFIRIFFFQIKPLGHLKNSVCLTYISAYICLPAIVLL